MIDDFECILSLQRILDTQKRARLPYPERPRRPLRDSRESSYRDREQRRA